MHDIWMKPLAGDDVAVVLSRPAVRLDNHLHELERAIAAGSAAILAMLFTRRARCTRTRAQTRSRPALPRLMPTDD